jgi:hypothetical protein
MLYRASPEPERLQLPSGRDAVLSRREIRHSRIGWPAFCMYVMRNASHPTRMPAAPCWFYTPALRLRNGSAQTGSQGASERDAPFEPTPSM